MADRVSVLLSDRQEPLSQVNGINTKIGGESGTKFHPEVMEAFMDVSLRDYIWFDLNAVVYDREILTRQLEDTLYYLDIDELVELSQVFQQVIDFRSHFTANHSKGVANVAVELADIIGFSEKEQLEMEVTAS